jgi:hypothetical protein
VEELASVLQDSYSEKHLVESATLSMDLHTIKEVARPQKRGEKSHAAWHGPCIGLL